MFWVIFTLIIGTVLGFALHALSEGAHSLVSNMLLGYVLTVVGIALINAVGGEE